METKDALVVFGIIALLAVTIIFGVRSTTNAAKADAATAMGSSLVELLQQEGYTQIYDGCRGVSPSDFAKLQRCLVEITTENEMTKFFVQDQFRNYDDRKAEKGRLIIRNEKGGKSFASANFTLFWNNEPYAEGCAISGEIAPGYTCRFDLAKPCVAGDTLEVKYGERRAFHKTC